MEATKKHKKGMKGQLEDMLKNAKRMQRMEDEDDEVNIKYVNWAKFYYRKAANSGQVKGGSKLENER